LVVLGAASAKEPHHATSPPPTTHSTAFQGLETTASVCVFSGQCNGQREQRMEKTHLCLKSPSNLLVFNAAAVEFGGTRSRLGLQVFRFRLSGSVAGWLAIFGKPFPHTMFKKTHSYTVLPTYMGQYSVHPGMLFPVLLHPRHHALFFDNLPIHTCFPGALCPPRSRSPGPCHFETAELGPLLGCGVNQIGATTAIPSFSTLSGFSPGALDLRMNGSPRRSRCCRIPG
jgi:hypothetical protein